MKRKGILLLLLGILLVVIDQVIKVLVKTHMTLGECIPVLGSWFNLVFVENKGMAFGMSFGGEVGKYILTAFRLGLFGLLVWWIQKLLRRSCHPEHGEGSPVPTGVLIGLTLITAGAFGNIIDCLFYGLVFGPSGVDTVAAFGGSYAPFMQGKVVDMFYFPLWRWPESWPLVGGHIFFEPVFNFADSCVTCGAIYLILFHWKFFSKE